MPLSEPAINLQLKEALLVSESYTFARAKKWLGFLLGLQCFIFVTGVAAIFIPAATLSYPYIAFSIAALNTWVSQRVAQLKGAADDCKRKHELYDGFGVAPSGKWLANFRLANPGALKTAEENLLRKGITYASSELPGPRRILENVVESSWFSHHLARWCATALAWGIFITGIFLVAVLFYLTSSTEQAESRDAAARAIAATFLFVISLGMIRALLSYQGFSRKADKCDDDATDLLNAAGEPADYDALRILNDYQMARASAPMIPTWVWKILRDRLNENWKIKKGEI